MNIKKWFKRFLFLAVIMVILNTQFGLFGKYNLGYVNTAYADYPWETVATISYSSTYYRDYDMVINDIDAIYLGDEASFYVDTNYYKYGVQLTGSSTVIELSIPAASTSWKVTYGCAFTVKRQLIKSAPAPIPGQMSVSLTGQPWETIATAQGRWESYYDSYNDVYDEIFRGYALSFNVNTLYYKYRIQYNTGSGIVDLSFPENTTYWEITDCSGSCTIYRQLIKSLPTAIPGQMSVSLTGQPWETVVVAHTNYDYTYDSDSDTYEARLLGYGASFSVNTLYYKYGIKYSTGSAIVDLSFPANTSYWTITNTSSSFTIYRQLIKSIPLAKSGQNSMRVFNPTNGGMFSVSIDTGYSAVVGFKAYSSIGQPFYSRPTMTYIGDNRFRVYNNITKQMFDVDANTGEYVETPGFTVYKNIRQPFYGDASIAYIGNNDLRVYNNTTKQMFDVDVNTGEYIQTPGFTVYSGNSQPFNSTQASITYIGHNRLRVYCSGAMYDVDVNTGEYIWVSGYTIYSAAGQPFYGSLPITMAYMDVLPSISATTPAEGSVFTESDTAYIPSVTVSDADNNALTCNLYFDGVLKETKTVTDTYSGKTISFNAIDFGLSTITEGNHTLKFEVSDGYLNTLSSPYTVNLKVDKSPPVIGTVTATSTNSSITVTGIATDSISNLATYPYRYKMVSSTGECFTSEWLTVATYTQSLSTLPNTQYTVTFEGKDEKGHIASSTQSIWTKAVAPYISLVDNPTVTSLDVSIGGGNSSATEYQIKTGTQYVTKNGNLSTTAEWITLTGNKITVTGLNQSTSYKFAVDARNGDKFPIAGSVSNTDMGSTLTSTPAAPTGLTYCDLSQTSVKLSWDAIPNATYTVRRNGTEIVGSPTANTYIDSTVKENTTYTYDVCATNVNAKPTTSDWSSVLSVTTLPNEPGVPTNLTVTPSTTSEVITWVAVSNATSYELVIDGSTINVGNVVTYTHSGLGVNTSHTYKVRAVSVNASNIPVYSAYTSLVTKYTLANLPTSGIIGTKTQTTVNTTWGANGNPPTVQYTLAAFNTSDVLVKQNAWTTNLSDIITGLTAETTYKIKVKARNSDGTETLWYSIGDVTTLPNPPAIPTNLTGSSTQVSVTLGWDSSLGATSYDIRVGGESGTITSNVTSPYTVTGLNPATSYSFEIRASNSGGTNGWSATLTVNTPPNPPAVPTNFTAVVQNKNEITVGWSASVGAVSYDLFIDNIDVENISTTSYNHTDLIPGTKHTYKVKAKNSGGDSLYSDEISGITTLDTPTGLTATATSEAMTVKWESVLGSSGYEIVINGTNYAVTGTSFTLEGIAASTPYTYKVRAKTEVTESNWSEEGTKSTMGAKPQVPQITSATATKTSAIMTWNPVSSATIYEIEVDGVITDNGNQTTYTHNGLLPSSNHTYRVRALNPSGKSAFSELSAITTADDANIITGVNFTSSTDTITISWASVDGVESYGVLADDTAPITVTQAVYTYMKLKAGSTHTYKINTIKQGTASQWSAAYSASTLPDPTIKVAGLTALQGSDSITISWTPIQGADKYDVEVDGIIIQYVTNIFYTHTNLAPATSHNYRVRAYKDGNRGEWSDELVKTTTQGKPKTPENLIAIPLSTSMGLVWDGADLAESYELEIDGVEVTTGTSTTYTKTGLLPNTQYTYRVRATNSSGNSEWSQAVQATTQYGTPEVPAGIKTESTSSSIKLTWGNVSGATGYEIEADGQTYETVENTYTHTGLTENTQHNYRIRAKGIGEKNSNYSSTITALTAVVLPEMPQNTTLTAAATSVTLTWDAVSTAQSYDIEADGVINNTTALTFTHSDLTQGTQHIYRIRSKKAGGINGVWSTEKTVLTKSADQLIPEGITAVAEETKVTLTWTAVEGAIGYDVEVDGQLIENGTSTTYIHTGDTAVIPGTQYSYKVRARTSEITGSFSTAITKIVPFGKVTGVATEASTTSITLSWNVSNGAQSYDLEIDDVIVSDIATNSYTHNKLLPGSSHTYRIRAKNPLVEGEWSDKITVNAAEVIYTENCNISEEFVLGISVASVQNIDKIQFVLTYNADELEVLDLCALTQALDNTTGEISGKSIIILQNVPGKIIFIRTDSNTQGQMWSGVVNSIKFKAKISGTTNIKYSIQ